MKARLLVMGLALYAAVVSGQEGQATAPEEAPAVQADPSLWQDAEPGLSLQPMPAMEPAADEGGSLILGDEDSPIGLYIMPWRNSAAEEGLGRPARLLQESLLPLDREVFKRQVDYYQTLAAHRARQSAAAQPSPAAP